MRGDVAVARLNDGFNPVREQAALELPVGSSQCSQTSWQACSQRGLETALQDRCRPSEKHSDWRHPFHISEEAYAGAARPLNKLSQENACQSPHQ